MVKKRNLAVEIGVLEAKKGLEPAISKCKSIAYERSRRHKLDDGNLEDTLQALRNERLSRKLYAVKKVVQRAAKKGRTFMLQKVIRKLRLAETEEKKAKLELQMKNIKAIDLPEMAKLLFEHKIIASNEYVASFTVGMIEHSKLDVEMIKLIEGAALEKTLMEITNDLERFLQSLFHKNLAKEKKPIPEKEFAQIKGQPKNPQTQERPTPNGEERPSKKSRIDGTASNEMPKRNRKGQHARRIEFEQRYGQDARHLQMPRQKRVESTVQQSDEKLHPSWEAQRKQRDLLKMATSQRPVNQKIKFADDE
jgi:hypothetical protein